MSREHHRLAAVTVNDYLSIALYYITVYLGRPVFGGTPLELFYTEAWVRWCMSWKLPPSAILWMGRVQTLRSVGNYMESSSIELSSDEQKRVELILSRNAAQYASRQYRGSEQLWYRIRGS